MLSDQQVKQAVDDLDQAERSRIQVPLLSLTHPEMTMADAYAVQGAWIDKKISKGRKAIGWKIGLTSKAMQAALKIDIPDSGVLLDDMLFEDGCMIGKDRFIQPRIEAEVAFHMKSDLRGPNVSAFDVLNATDYITPALEILDTRIVRVDALTGKSRNVMDTIADNAANAGIVIGGRAVRLGDVDARWIGAIVSRNGQVEETGLGAGVLNDPVRGVVWLANRLSEYGDWIKAGQIVLAGSFIRPIETAHGDTITADFGPLGTISCYFA